LLSILTLISATDTVARTVGSVYKQNTSISKYSSLIPRLHLVFKLVLFDSVALQQARAAVVGQNIGWHRQLCDECHKSTIFAGCSASGFCLYV